LARRWFFALNPTKKAFLKHETFALLTVLFRVPRPLKFRRVAAGLLVVAKARGVAKRGTKAAKGARKAVAEREVLVAAAWGLVEVVAALAVVAALVGAVPAAPTVAAVRVEAAFQASLAATCLCLPTSRILAVLAALLVVSRSEAFL